MARILVATRNGLQSLEDGPSRAPTELPDRSVSFLARAANDLYAILDDTEIWRQVEGAWRHVATMDGLHARCLAFTDRWLVGTSEARLFQLADDRLTPIEAFDAVTGRDTWYTPWGGPPDTRSIAEWDEHVYVNVHVGGIQHTQDAGATWAPTIDIDADVHQVTTTEGMVLAACAGGLAVSTDSGASWTYRTDGLEHRYARGVAVWGDTVLVSASRGHRGGEAGVYRADLAGGAFDQCRAGLPEWFEDNIDSYCLDAPPDGPVAALGTSDGRVYATTDVGSTWTQIAEGLPAIQRVLVAP
jgi:hypothetical protein